MQWYLQATDVDIDPRIATATATVIILDINDNSPVFDQPNYATSVAENHPSNFFVSSDSITTQLLILIIIFGYNYLW